MSDIERHASRLADVAPEALERWVVRSVDESCRRAGVQPSGAITTDAGLAARQAADVVGHRLRELLERDIDQQPSTPLEVLRSAVAYPTEVLRSHGVACPEREAEAIRRFPDDAYGLVPANFADIDPSLTEAAMAWGAAKAFVHLQRHKRG